MKNEGSTAGTNHGAGAPRWSRDQALKEMEKRLWTERSRQAAACLREVLAAEQALERQPADIVEPGVLPPGRPPDTWIGEEGQETRYRSTSLWPAGRQSESEPQASPQRGRSVALLALEMIALAGFLLILVVSYVQLQDLNRELRQAQSSAMAGEERQVVPSPVEPTIIESKVTVAQPSPSATATPAPTRTRLVPSPTVESALVVDPPTRTITATAEASPTVPTATPTVTPSPTPTATPTVARRAGSWLLIPALDLDAPIVEGDDSHSLTKGVGRRLSSAAPGESSNCVLSAHNDVYGAWFRDLHKLQAGDQVEIHTVEATFIYTVRLVEIVSPYAVEFLEPTETPVLTLISCYPIPLNTHRVVAVADLTSTHSVSTLPHDTGGLP
jgi:LPXTG-site transpeptidase (sortase) family protein